MRTSVFQAAFEEVFGVAAFLLVLGFHGVELFVQEVTTADEQVD